MAFFEDWFDDATVSGGWTQTTNAATISEADSFLVTVVSGSSSYARLLQTLDKDDDWDIKLSVTDITGTKGSGSGVGVGLYVLSDDSSFIRLKVGSLYFDTDNGSGGGSFGNYQYLRISKVGTTYRWYGSNSPNSGWSEGFGSGKTITPTSTIQVGIEGLGGTGTSNYTASYDWILNNSTTGTSTFNESVSDSFTVTAGEFVQEGEYLLSPTGMWEDDYGFASWSNIPNASDETSETFATVTPNFDFGGGSYFSNLIVTSGFDITGCSGIIYSIQQIATGKAATGSTAGVENLDYGDEFTFSTNNTTYSGAINYVSTTWNDIENLETVWAGLSSNDSTLVSVDEFKVRVVVGGNYVLVEHITGETYNDSVSGTMTFSDSATAEVIFNAGTGDSFTISDGASEIVQFVTTALDSFTLNDISPVEMLVDESLSDSMSIDASIDADVEFEASAQDDIEVTAQLDADAEFNASAADGMTVDDMISAGVEINLVAADSFTVNDSVLGQATFNCVSSDGFTLTVYALSGEDVQDSFTISDSAYCTLVQNVVATDSFTVNDSSGNTITFDLIAADQMTVTDSVGTIMTIVVGVADQINLSDTVSASNNILTEAVETILATDSANCIADMVETISDAISASDEATAALTVNVTINDGFTVEADTVPDFVFNVGTSDSFVIADTIDNNVVMYISVLDQMVVADEVLSGIHQYAEANDTFTLDDIAGAVVQINIAASDQFDVNDQAEATMSFIENISDGMEVSATIEDTSTVYTIKFLIKEKEQQFEARPKNYGFESSEELE